MKKRITLIAVVVALATFVAVPLAFGGPGGHRGHGGFRGGIFGHLEHLKSELELSDNQVAQIKVIFAELHEQNGQYRDSMRGGVKDAAEALLKDPNNLAAAQAILDQQFAAEKAVKANLLVATSKALNVLTAEQRAELAKIVEERSERRERRRNR